MVVVTQADMTMIAGVLGVTALLSVVVNYMLLRNLQLSVRLVTLAVLWVVASIIVLGSVGVSIEAILLLVGIIGFTFAYALRNVIASYIAFNVFVRNQQPFKIGDMISIGGVTGRVIAQNNLSTIIATDEGDIIYYPNYRLLEEPIRVVGKGGVRPRVFLAVPRDKLEGLKRRITELSAELRGMLSEGRAIELHVKNIFQDKLLVELTIPVSNPNIRSDVVSLVLEKCADYTV